MPTEHQIIAGRFKELIGQESRAFPKPREQVDAPTKPGVYIIYRGGVVLHVGRTVRGKNGIRQRLNNHLHNASSFTNTYLDGNGEELRSKKYSYKYLVVQNSRKRALLENYAICMLCPKHLGLGE